MARSIDGDKCVRCGACGLNCPMGLLCLEHDGMRFEDEAEALCIFCGHCIAACPADAVSIDALPKERFPLLSDAQASPGQLQELMDGRRSVRAFLDRPVERAKLERMLEAVATVPVACGGNPMPVSVVNGREKIAAMVGPMMEFHRKFYRGMQSPIFRHVFRLMLGRNKFTGLKQFMPIVGRMLDYYDATGNDCITWGAPALLIFHAPSARIAAEADPVIACTYAMLAARAEGLGTTMIGMIPPYLNERPKEKERLGVPRENSAVISLIAGYPKGRYVRGIRREVRASWV